MFVELDRKQCYIKLDKLGFIQVSSSIILKDGSRGDKIALQGYHVTLPNDINARVIFTRIRLDNFPFHRHFYSHLIK